MPTTTTTSSITGTIQKLETTYGPQVVATGHATAAAYSSHLAAFQFMSVLLSIAFMVGTVYIVIKTGWLRVRMDRIDDVVFKSDVARKHMEESWEDVERHFFSGDVNELKIAIVKADALLDEALRNSGALGKDLGDRLKKLTTAQLPNLENIWEAHKLRNRIAHEVSFVLKRDLAERALTVYEEALEHLGVLTPIAPNKSGPKEGNRSPR